jgi:hypothetical protein
MTGPPADSDPELTDAQSTHEQRIHAENRAARGAIGADLHLWGDDVLLHVLENWHDASSPGLGKAMPPPDSQDLRPGTADSVVLIISYANQT